jgi:hypothetical protein
MNNYVQSCRHCGLKQSSDHEHESDCFGDCSVILKTCTETERKFLDKLKEHNLEKFALSMIDNLPLRKYDESVVEYLERVKQCKNEEIKCLEE